MATKSILKNIIITDPQSGKDLVRALERAENMPAKDVSLSKSSKEIRGDELRRFLSK